MLFTIKRNNLTITHPQLAEEWHPFKNQGLKPEYVTAGSNIDAWWLLPYDDLKTGKHFDFEWRARIQSRADGHGCPYLTGNKVWPGFNDLATHYPQLAMEWHPTKNGDLTPDQVRPTSNKKVWWFLPYDDPKTGKHFEFEWEASISDRVRYGHGCPFLTGNKVWPGFNDLATHYPQLAMEWHPTKNGDLTPDQVSPTSNRKVWWFLPYDDPKTGELFEFEWEATIASRSMHGRGCPFLKNKAAWPGFNDLMSQYPDIAMELNSVKNRVSPEDITIYSNHKYFWICNKCSHEWYDSVENRTIYDLHCPNCRQKAKEQSWYL